MPIFHLDRYWRNCRQMMSTAQQRCREYYREAEAGKKLMLVYNTIGGEELTLKMEDVPADWVITTDRRHLQQADVVVFHLPGLHQEVENDLDKPEGQIWVSWYTGSEKDHPLINDPEIKDLFDLWISHSPKEEQEEHPLVWICRSMN